MLHLTEEALWAPCAGQVPDSICPPSGAPGSHVRRPERAHHIYSQVTDQRARILGRLSEVKVISFGMPICIYLKSATKMGCHVGEGYQKFPACLQLTPSLQKLSCWGRSTEQFRSDFLPSEDVALGKEYGTVPIRFPPFRRCRVGGGVWSSKQ